MKIRRPWVIRTLCMLGFWFLRALLATVFCKYWYSGPDLRPINLKAHERYIYVMWHEYLLVPMVEFNHASCRLLVSQHADGSIVGEICKHLRMGLVRGSTTRGGAEAVRRLLRPSRYRCLAFAPDGPRGPRRRVHQGVVYLSSRLGWPIVPVGVGYLNPWRLRSWDRLAIPKPYHRAVVVTTDPIIVPPNLDKASLEIYRQEVENALLTLTAKAERAVSGQRPLSDETPESPQNKTAA